MEKSEKEIEKEKLLKLQKKYKKMPVKSRLDAMKKQYFLDTVKEALKKL